MKATVEREGPTKLRLLVEVEPDELAPLYQETLRRLAKETDLPGFRKGKVPPPLLESRLGKETVSQESLKEAVPHFYGQALGEHEIRAVSLPEIEVTQFEDGGPLHFTATFDVRPEINLPEYRGIEVARPETDATEEEIGAQLERLRERFATLEPVGRNADKGDFVTIDLHAHRHDQKIEEASADDLLYEIGSETFVPELDVELQGKRVGDILKFNATLPERMGELGGDEVTFSVVVKEVQARRLPPLDDDFAKTASEFETLDELRTEIRARLDAIKGAEAEGEVRRRVLEDLVERTDIPVPESMVARETELRLAGLLRDLERAEVSLDSYLEAAKTTREEIVDSQRRAAEQTVAAQLVLEAVAKQEGIDVATEEVDKEIAQLAEQFGRESEELRRDLDEAGRVEHLTGDILRRKALDFLVEQAKITEASRKKS